MASSKRRQRCAYCGHGASTTDHVIPRALYPPSRTASKVQRITVAACAACNEGWADDEPHFRNVLLVSGNPNPAVRELWEGKTLRSFTQVDGPKRVHDLATQIVPVKTPDGERHMIYPAKDERVLRIVRKVVRGLCHHHKLLSPVHDGQVMADIQRFLVPPELLSLMTVAHAARVAAVRLAQTAGCDVITHAPLDAPAPDAWIEAMVTQSLPCIPTLVMMRAMATALSARGPGLSVSFDHAFDSVAALLRAGGRVIAGTDANQAPASPTSIRHGISLHEELELLVAAGSTPTDAIRSATVAPADVFGLPDRGVVEPGRRADLVLLDRDPTVDIAATRQIRAVWCGGVRHEPATKAVPAGS